MVALSPTSIHPTSFHSLAVQLRVIDYSSWGYIDSYNERANRSSGPRQPTSYSAKIKRFSVPRFPRRLAAGRASLWVVRWKDELDRRQPIQRRRSLRRRIFRPVTALCGVARTFIEDWGFDVPRKIVDFSARSAYLREEPFHLHFWENSVEDYLSFLRDPRGQLEQIGIHLPPDCRIETVIENHDWLAQKTAGLASDNGTIICNVGTGNVARAVYRIVSYAHSHDAIGSHKKELLHGIDEEERA
jgi:hypothetical protein